MIRISNGHSNDRNRTVLIVSPRFPPSNAPDMQRVRMALPYFREFGWRSIVLAVEPEFVPCPNEPLLVEGIPSDVDIFRTKAVSIKTARRFRIGGLSIRAGRSLDREGQRILRNNQVDAIYFSTTEFGVFQLGPKWLARFQVPYVLDYQDPWRTDYYRKSKIRPPGGFVKHGLMQMVAKWREPGIVRKSAHVTAVSSDYTEQLSEQYAIDSNRFTVLPFGGSNRDFETVIQSGIVNPVFDANDGKVHWVYAGVAGPYMKRSLTAIFLALKRFFVEHPILADKLCLHFVGTDYASRSGADGLVTPIAQACGVGNLVFERTDRIPYFQVLRCLTDADALLMPGSDDAGYTASKLYPYILAQKPLLSVFHHNSSVNQIMSATKAGINVAFNPTEPDQAIADRIYKQWFHDQSFERKPETNWSAFEPYTAREMTRKLVCVLDKAVDGGGP